MIDILHDSLQSLQENGGLQTLENPRLPSFKYLPIYHHEYFTPFDVVYHCTRYGVVKQPKYQSGDTWKRYVCTILVSLFASSIITLIRLEVTESYNKIPLEQRFSNFFQVGTTFISQNVLRTTLLLGLSDSLGLP